MEANKILQADYLDILFDNRNKSYGGYALRKHEDRRMVQAFLFIAAIILSFSIWTFIDARNAEDAITPVIIYCPIDLTKIKPREIILPEPVIPETQPAAAKPTIKNPIPVIAPDEIVTVAPPPVDSMVGREPGPVTNAGNPAGNAVATKTTGTGNAAIVAPPVTPIDYAEVMPEFIGDIYQYLNKTVRYPRAAVNAGIQGRVIVQFVVNEDGRIANAKLLRGIGGGCDEEALRVVNAMPAWKPGKQNGQPVKVYYKLPISFRLE